MMNRKRFLPAAVTLLACVFSRTASADLVLSVTPSAPSYNVGDSGFVDVMIYSTSADELDSYLMGVNITGGSGAVFTDPQSESFLSDSDYVFFGRSSSLINALPATTVGAGGSEVTVVDLTEDPLNAFTPLPVTLPGAGLPGLLTRLTFDAVSPGTFGVEVDPSSSFADVGFGNFSYTATGTSFSVNAAAVPEPASVILGGITCLAAGGMWFRRRRNRSSVSREGQGQA
ncbi:hypothetical protein [Fuerstiella marisgermanici]|nr:hypothetical protein [Fuerstiella marisgermanici]